MTLEELLAVAEIVEKLTNRYRDQEAAHKAALTEIRASFNARTSADGKRYEGILDTYRSELDEIDAALNPEREESTALVAKRLVEERDALRAEVARLKSQTTKHPVKVPCDPPATHDTPEGRSVAESVIRDFRTTEPAADIKDGDIVEVVSSTHKIYTEYKDLGRRGVVTAIDGMRVSVGAVPGYELPIRGIVGKCDVRKVTT